MAHAFTRRQFARAGAVAGLASLLPRGNFAATGAHKKAVILADQEIGVVRPEFHGHFAEHLGSCVYGGIWVGPQSPIPNINGCRKDLVAYLKELGVPVLRWPGGCYADDYHWRDGIGPVAKRPKHVNTSWGGYVEDNSFGTHEFITFCRLIGAEPYFAANVGTGSPKEMRDWMEYCNYPSGSTLSDERTANGSPEPFNVRYWGVGNELWGCGGNFRPEAAAAEFRHYATFARRFGEVAPFLVGCGPSNDDSAWTRGFMDAIGNRLPNGYSMHYYERGSMAPTEFTPQAAYTQFNLFPRVEAAVIHQRALLDGYDPTRRIGLILDEWGVWDQIPRSGPERGLWQQSTMRSAVAAALGLNIFNRQADKLYMGNIAQMVNVLQSVILTDGPAGKTSVRTTTYWAFMLFKPHRGKTALRVESDAPPLPLEIAGRGGRSDVTPPEPKPDLSISASRQGSELVATFVNPRHDVDMTVDCALRGVSAKKAQAQILHDSDMNASNSFDNPDRLMPRPHEVAAEGNRIRITLPAMSVATVTAQVA